MKFRAAVFLSLGLAIGAAAGARADETGPSADASAKPIVVNANFQTRIAIDPSASTSEITKALTQANQSLGELVNRECEVFAAAFKSECRVGLLNIGANVNDRRAPMMVNNEFNGAQRFLNANLNATFELTPTAATTKGAPAAQ